MKKSINKKSPILDKIDPSINLSEDVDIGEKENFPESRQGTAMKAVKILVDLNQGYIKPNNKVRLNILIAFAKKNKVVYGKAFDIIRLNGSSEINLEDQQEVEKHLDNIIVYEVKSTNKKEVKLDFDRYFFGLSTAELLVAQSLRSQFKFVFVNTNTNEILELTLKQVFEKAKGIYPVWSIQF